MVSPDPTNASNLSSGDVPLAQLGNAPATDTTTLEDDIALLGFKVAVNGSLAKYNLVDQTEDAFMDATGIDAGASTGEVRNAANYYSGSIANNATGGTITDVGTDKVHTFLNADNGSATNNFVVPVGGIASVDFLVIAGGGGGGVGGNGRGGGGGAGGYRASFNSEASGGGGSSETALTMTAATYAVIAGSGGALTSSVSIKGGSGADSVFSTVTSTGGGGGASMSNTGGLAGGSGGGAGLHSDAVGAGTTNQGYAGGQGSSSWEAGGGGGSGQVGQIPTAGPTAGAGGYGVSSTITGVSVQRGGGGGGSADATGGAGGAGGGGLGNNAGAAGGQGTDATGSGGGGAGAAVGSGRGGHGVVIARYTTQVVGADMVLQSNSTTAETTPTKGDIVMTYTNGLGTATLNTDLTAEFSADNGSTWTSTTLVAQGSTGTHLIVSAHDVTRTSTSGTSMVYRIKTLNQSAAKETRIQAVSLGWS